MKRLLFILVLILTLTSMSIAQWTTEQMQYKINKIERSWSPVVYSAAGTIIADTQGVNTTPTAGSRYWVELNLHGNIKATGISYLVGTTAGADTTIAELYRSDSTLVTSTAATVVGTAKTIQSITFTATVLLQPGKYFIALQFKNNSARFRTHSITGSKFIAGSTTGTFGTAAAFSPGSSYTASKAPFCALY